MKTRKLPAREIPLDDSWDVIVAGGGPAGCTAAAAAAREGTRTLLIESTGCLGGMGTSGLVPAWCPFSDKEKIIYRGLAETVFDRCKAGMPHIRKSDLDWVAIDPELLKRIYDDLVLSAGAKVLFHTVLSAVETDSAGGVTALVVSNKRGLSALRANVYVDCTGDADLAAWAGAEFHKGEDGTGDLQPATHCFSLTNVDDFAYNCRDVSRRQAVLEHVIASGKYPIIPDGHFCNSLIGPRTVGFNAGHIWNVDNTDPWSVSAALVRGRKMAAAFRDALAEFWPAAFGNAFLAATGSLLGVRETRRIVGDYVLTVEDYIQRRSFDDEICRNSYFIDIHWSAREAREVRTDNKEWESRCLTYGKGESHGVPYRCLTPKGLSNVLVAGRSISCDRKVQGSVRVMPVCLAMGEAAGIAAALAAPAATVNVHAADVQALRATIRRYGGYLP